MFIFKYNILNTKIQRHRIVLLSDSNNLSIGICTLCFIIGLKFIIFIQLNKLLLRLVKQQIQIIKRREYDIKQLNGSYRTPDGTTL